MATVTELTKQLVGNGYRPSAPALKHGARELFTRGKVLSGFTRGIAGSAEAGDIARTAITAERLASVGRDVHPLSRDLVEAHEERQSQGQDDQDYLDGMSYTAPPEAPVETVEWSNNFYNPPMPTVKLNKPSTAMNLDQVNSLYAKRKHIG